MIERYGQLRQQIST
ncbi:hypothetical protein YPPY98_2465, partial [Yersinia pestis PY-98]